jgi:hypothetical protein
MTQEQLQQFAADIAQNIKDSQPAPAPPPAPEPVTPQPPTGIDAMSDTDLIEAGTLKNLNRQYEQRVSGLMQGMETLYNQNVTMFEQSSRIQNPQIWEKYGKEITAEIEQVKKNKVLDAADYNRAIEIVRGRHYKDFVEAEAQRMLETTPTSDGVGDGGLQVGTTADHEIPEHWKEILARNDMNLDSVRAMIAKRQANGDNITLEGYLKMMENQTLVRDDKGYTTRDLISKK